MRTQRKIDGLRHVLAQIRLRLKMLESAAPAKCRDNELRKRIGEVKVEEEVVLSKLSELGAEP